jgi:hypothetical protein
MSGRRADQWCRSRSPARLLPLCSPNQKADHVRALRLRRGKTVAIDWGSPCSRALLFSPSPPRCSQHALTVIDFGAVSVVLPPPPNRRNRLPVPHKLRGVWRSRPRFS